MERAYLCSQSCRLGQQELPRLLRMLMRIILQVRKRRSDVATRQSNGFFVVQSRHQEKNPAGHSKVNVTHCAFVRASRERKNRLICLQRELWLCGLNQPGLDKAWMKKEPCVPAATKGRSNSITVGIISHCPIIFQQHHGIQYMARFHS